MLCHSFLLFLGPRLLVPQCQLSPLSIGKYGPLYLYHKTADVPDLSCSNNTLSNFDTDENSLSLLYGHNEQQQSSTSVTAVTSNPVLWLNLVAILWGSQHAVIKTVVQDSDPGALTLLRFGLAAVLASPYLPPVIQPDNATTQSTWRWGAELGLWMFLGFAFQAIGLEYTTAQKSGFLLYLNVKFVPFLAWLLLGRMVSLPTTLSALTAFAGTALLASSGSNSGIGWNVGDLWTIVAALSSAMFILRLEAATQEVIEAAQLNAACLWVVAALSTVWVMSTSHDAESISNIWSMHSSELVYLGGVTTALANWIQTKAQKSISAQRASIIYAMDPVYGAAFSAFLLGERLDGWVAWLGAALITVAAACNAFLDPNQVTSSPTQQV